LGCKGCKARGGVLELCVDSCGRIVDAAVKKLP
jgi:hypothetical protein